MVRLASVFTLNVCFKEGHMVEKDHDVIHLCMSRRNFAGYVRAVLSSRWAPQDEIIRCLSGLSR